jgi:hypothetical protein
MITLLAMIGLATAGGPLESAQMDGTAHAPRQGDIFLKPFGTSSLGLTDRLAISTNAPDWVNGSANISSEFNIVDNWEYALSITPYASADFGLEQIRTGAIILHSLQYAEDRLNTSVRLGFVGNRGTYESLDLDEFSKGMLEGEVGLSYDIVVSRSMVHRFKGAISGDMSGLSSLQAGAGYSFNAALGERARLELGVDVGTPSSVSGQIFQQQYAAAVYGDDIGDQAWAPSPNASVFWVF